MTDALVHIIVGDDFGDAGRHAIREALRRGRNAHLHFTHVVKDQGAAETATHMEAAQEKLWTRVSEVGAEVLGLEAANVSVHVRIGDAFDAINQVAVDYRADLIIVGTKDMKGLKSLGSVATQLIHHASCSVLVARSQDYSHARQTERPDPPNPNQDLHEERIGTGYRGTQRVSWNPARTGVKMY